jgi:hypothetical protein
MTLEQEYKEKYEIGFPIFEKFFNLKKDDFVNVMKDIFQDDDSILEILENKPTVTKTIIDDIPQNISICFYSSIEITYNGISYKPEHGNTSLILKFNKFFNIDAINY